MRFAARNRKNRVNIGLSASRRYRGRQQRRRASEQDIESI
jgi:hypothetical protein